MPLPASLPTRGLQHIPAMGLSGSYWIPGAAGLFREWLRHLCASRPRSSVLCCSCHSDLTPVPSVSVCPVPLHPLASLWGGVLAAVWGGGRGFSSADPVSVRLVGGQLFQPAPRLTPATLPIRLWGLPCLCAEAPPATRGLCPVPALRSSTAHLPGVPWLKAVAGPCVGSRGLCWVRRPWGACEVLACSHPTGPPGPCVARTPKALCS